MKHDCDNCKKQGACDQETILKHLADVYAKLGVEGLVTAVMSKFSLEDDKKGETSVMYVEAGCQVIGIDNLQDLQAYTNGCRKLVSGKEHEPLESMLKMQAFYVAEFLYQEAGNKIRSVIKAMSPATSVSFDVAIEEREVALPPVRMMH